MYKPLSSGTEADNTKVKARSKAKKTDKDKDNFKSMLKHSYTHTKSLLLLKAQEI